MKIDRNMPLADVVELSRAGIVVPCHAGEMTNPQFERKEKPVPPGMMRLSSGRLVPHQPIQECLAKW